MSLPLKSWRLVSETLLALIAASIIGYFVIDNRQILADSFKPANLGTLGLIAISTIAHILVRAIRDHKVLKVLTYRIRFTMLLRLHLIQNILNYLPAKAGTIFLAAALKKNSKVAYSHFSASIIAQNIITLSIALLLSGLALLVATQGSAIWPSLILTVLALTSVMVLLIKIPFKHHLPNRASDFLQHLEQGLTILTKGQGIFFLVSMLSLFSLLLSAWRFMLIFVLVGIDVDLISSLAIACFSYAGYLVSLTPSGIGIREAFAVAVASLLELPANLTIIMSTIDRASFLAISATVLLIYTLYISYKKITRSGTHRFNL